MGKCAKYKIITELKVIVEYFEGDIFLNDMIDFETREMNDKDYNPKFNMITDLRNVELIASENDVLQFVSFMKKTTQLLDQRKVAIITNTPKQAALTTLYVLYFADSPIVNKVFSTLKGAIEWIGLPSEKISVVEDAYNEIIKC
jgi:hypothetical protein